MAPPTPGSGGGSDLRVLLVDDEEEFVRTVAKVLGRRGFVVEVALSGEEGLAQLAAHHFDVAVLDLRMPGMDGLETLTLARRRHPDLKVIILTGHATTSLGIEGMRLGAADFMTKPVEPDTLALAIQAAVGGAGSRARLEETEEEET